MRTKFLVLLFAASLFASDTLSAQSKRKYVNEFMYTGVGGRQMGMGKTGVASTNDVYGTYWNPVGLTDIKDNLQVGFMHNFYFQNLANFDFIGISGKGKDGNTFGFSILRFGVDKILNTLDLIRNGQVDYQRVSEFSAVDYAFMPSYAHSSRQVRNHNLNVGWGITAKIIHRRVGPFATSWGFGADAALRINDYNGRFGFTLLAKDITTTFNNWSFNFTDNQKDVYSQTGETVPVNSLELATPRFIAGGFYNFTSGNYRLTPEVNLEFTTDGQRNTLVSSEFVSIDPRIGIEAGLADPIKKFEAMLRMGLYNTQRQLNSKGKRALTVTPSVGVGVKFDNISIDYALAGLGEGGTGLYSNIISIAVGINKESK